MKKKALFDDDDESDEEFKQLKQAIFANRAVLINVPSYENQNTKVKLFDSEDEDVK